MPWCLNRRIKGEPPSVSVRYNCQIAVRISRHHGTIKYSQAQTRNNNNNKETFITLQVMS